jgi:prephenate dehydrogenase (NADP+)
MKIGIIGLGDMGKLFARIWASYPEFTVFGCGRPENFHALEREFENTNIHILEDGIAVSRICDFILYSVEAENIKNVIQKYGPSTKFGAIVSAQTSVKSQEFEALRDYIPQDAQLVSCHALYGPTVNPNQQTIIVYNQRASNEAYLRAKDIFSKIGSEIFELNGYDPHKQHDKIMADIQAVTHICFESIGSTFTHKKVYPWEQDSQNGIDNVKMLLTLRIFNSKAHVYSGLALQNPFAKDDIRNYAIYESELFELMLMENEAEFRDRLYKARDFVFKDHQKELMLNDDLMKEFSLNPNIKHKPNSHLSILAMVETWYQLKINPYSNPLCHTPIFKLRIGLAEYLFLNNDLLEETIQTALYDKSIRGEDLAFHTSVHEWANIVELGDKNGYQKQFDAAKNFLSNRLEEGKQKSNLLIARLQNR